MADQLTATAGTKGIAALTARAVAVALAAAGALAWAGPGSASRAAEPSAADAAAASRFGSPATRRSTTRPMEAGAADPTPDDAKPDEARPDARPGGSGPRVRRESIVGVHAGWAGGGGGRLGPNGEGDRSAAMEFMARYAPEQHKYIAASPEREQLERLVVRAFRNYQQISLNDPEGLYPVILQRVQAEDQIFALTADLRRAAPGADRDAAIAKLRAAVVDWTDITLHERQLRLTWLERSAQQERDKLAEDRAHKERLVRNRLNRIANGELGDSWLPAGGGGGNGGGGKGGGSSNGGDR